MMTCCRSGVRVNRFRPHAPKFFNELHQSRMSQVAVAKCATPWQVSPLIGNAPPARDKSIQNSFADLILQPGNRNP
jgi:hypothetical protein